MVHLKPEKRAVLLMVICSSLWSIAGIFIKLIPWNPLVIAGWRSLFSAACVLVYQRFTGQTFRLNRASIRSGIFLAVTFLLFVSANKLTTAANAIVLQFTAPVFILILSVLFLKQKVTLPDLLTVLLTMGGISLFFFDQLSPGNLFGNFVAIGAGFSMAAMYLATGSTDEESRMSGILLGHLFTAAIGIPFLFVYETPVTMPAVLSILTLGIVQLGIPYLLYGIAVKDCPPLACSLLGAIEPLLNPVWVFLFTGERPGVFALLGGAVVIATITVWCVWRDRYALQTNG
ncbi:DMT family transporter [Marasmitruncus massiliensis]|uniref:DMT family transporter n=1 Tax=Marasmitruncus massiliensis TaxID=1944642 RepID=UPI000C7CB81A|nr:DMT family transporter [Marasmitruncus massiliensis]